MPILIFLYYALSPFPELKSFEKRNYSVQFYDRNERLIYVTALDGGLRREFIPYENIPEHVKKGIAFHPVTHIEEVLDLSFN